MSMKKHIIQGVNIFLFFPNIYFVFFTKLELLASADVYELWNIGHWRCLHVPK